MKEYLTKYLILTKVIFIIFLAINCDDNTVEIPPPINANATIISPLNNSFFKKHDPILFKAYLISQNDTLDYDSLRWEINNRKFRSSNFSIMLSVGSHEVQCKIYKDNEVYPSSVLITVENILDIEQISENNPFSLYRIPEDRIWCLGIDENDNVIIGTERTGLYIKNNDSWINYDIHDGLHENLIQTVSTQNEDIYFGYGSSEGITKISQNGLSHISVNISLYGDKDVHDILFDKNNVLWIALHEGTVATYLNNNWSTYPEQDVDFHHPHKIMFDNNDVLWGASGYGSIKYDGKSWDSVYVNEEILRSTCLEIDNNTIWFGSTNGLYRITDVDTIVYNTSNSELPTNYIKSIAIDSKHKIWLGTNVGIFTFNGLIWEIIDLPIDDKFINSLVIDSDDKIWFSNSTYYLESAIFGSYKQD
jgi:ligand-binding sensor domain-containing protein